MDHGSPVGSLRDYVTAAARYAGAWGRDYEEDVLWQPWFRGEPDGESETALRPVIYRSAKGWADIHCWEQEFRLEFRRRAPPLLASGAPSDHWEWYFLMRHHGVPTRLLDWTTNALAALYFAVRSAQPGNRPAVYALDPHWLNDLGPLRGSGSSGVAEPDWDEARPYLSRDSFATRLRPASVLAIAPPYVGPRLSSQQGRFVIFGSKPNALMDIVSAQRRPRLKRILVEAGAAAGLLGELRLTGMTEDVVFPDLDGLGRELSNRFRGGTAGAPPRAGRRMR